MTGEDAATLVAKMTLAEKADFCSGADVWRLPANTRLGLPAIMLTDGPHGLRKQAADKDHPGLTGNLPATCFPTASALASTWDVDLLSAVGVALGAESAAADVAVVLGPAMNIKRHPLCGRNFEYFSEDPLLSGKLAVAMVQGIQSQGVGACITHFAANDQEHRRMVTDVVVDERTLREIHLRGFEIAVKEAAPWMVMSAYNRINGVYCSENDWLLNQVLRRDWGFEGTVVTDWGAANDRPRGLEAGDDLEMPTSGSINDRRIISAVERGELAEEALDRSVARVVEVVLKSLKGQQRASPPDFDAHHALARRAAAEGTVLLKNDNDLLPLSPASNIAVIGSFAKTPRYQGTGSSRVTPTRLDCAFDALREVLGDPGTRLSYAAGYDPEESGPDGESISEAVAIAAAADVAVVFVGLPAVYESEGFDRTHTRLPEQHDRLGDWMAPAGAYEVRLGASSRDIRLRKRLVVNSSNQANPTGVANDGPVFSDGQLNVDDVAFASMLGRPVPAAEEARPFHLNSTLSEVASTRLGRRVANAVKAQFFKRMGGGDPATRKMIEHLVDDMPLRSLVLFFGGRISFHVAEAFTAVLNGRYLRALRLLVAARR